MKPTEFKEQNKVLSKPDNMTDEECSSLPVYTDGKLCISCWELTWRDIWQIIKTRRVWLWVLSGRTQPPVIVSADFPFLEGNDGDV